MDAVDAKILTALQNDGRAKRFENRLISLNVIC